MSRPPITKHGSALYIGMAKVLPIIDVLGYDGQNSSFSSSLHYSDLTPIAQKGSHINASGYTLQGLFQHISSGGGGQ